MNTLHMARIIRTCALPMTSQALADLALSTDQERRRAFAAGDYARAAALQVEVSTLVELLP